MADNIQTEVEESSSHPGLLPLSILRTLWKRRARIVAAWALFALVTVAVVRHLPPVYVAESVVLIDSQKIPENFVSSTVARDLEERVAAVRQMLLSGGELRKVIDEFRLYREDRKTHAEEEILEMMRKDISITIEAAGPGKRPGTFRIGYQGPDPAIVMLVANRLTDLYVQRSLQTREGQAEGTSGFLDSELSVAKKRLDELEATVSSYKVKYNGELPEQEASLSRALSELHTQLQANMDALNRAQQSKVVQESTLSAMEASAAVQTVRAFELVGREGEAGVTTTPAPSRTYRKASEALEAQLAELLTKVTEEHPAAIKLRTSIETAKREEELEQSRESGLKAQIEVTEKELRELTVNQRRILRDLEGYQHRIERLPVREQEMAQITRDYEMSKTNYKSLLDKKMAAGVALDMERRQQAERFIVLDRARLPAKPLKPERPLLYAGGSVIGLALALLLGLIAELRQNVILGEWELKEDIPVLARLPQFEIQECSSQIASPVWRRLFSRNRGLTSASTT